MCLLPPKPIRRLIQSLEVKGDKLEMKGWNRKWSTKFSVEKVVSCKKHSHASSNNEVKASDGYIRQHQTIRKVYRNFY